MAEDPDPPVDDAAKLQERLSYLESELKKAVKARDAAKQNTRMSADEREELDALRAARAEAEDAQARKQGEFEKIEQKLNAAREAAEQKAAEAEARFAKKAVETAFSGASTLFGSGGLTTLTPDLALGAFRDHVRYLPGENGDGGSIVVHDLTGAAITGDDGTPLPFADAMERLIEAHPSKAAILRGSGRTGSGAGAPHDHVNTHTATRAELVRAAQSGDKAALERLRETQPASQVSGRMWEQRAQARRDAAG